MDATEICPISQKAIEELIQGRQREDNRLSKHERREAPRWPFPAPVELWLPNDDGSDDYLLATCENLSLGGMGIRCDLDLELNQEIGVAIHQPEVSFHGKAIVRHTTKLREDYYVGLQFVFA